MQAEIKRQHMRKMVLSMLLASGAFLSGNSQDIIQGVNGEKIKAKVLEINPSEIKYKRFDNPDGPTYTILKADVGSIQYPNGTIDVFSKQENAEERKSSVNESIERTQPVEQYNILGYWKVSPESQYVGYYHIFREGDRILLNQFNDQVQLKKNKFIFQDVMTQQLNPDGSIHANVYEIGTWQYVLENDSIFNIVSPQVRSKITVYRLTPEQLTSLKITDDSQQNINSESTSGNNVAVKDSDVKTEGLLGRVKEYTVCKYTSLNNRDTNNLILQSKINMKFNEAGNYSELIMFNASGNGQIDNKALFTYDQKNNLVLKTYFNGNNEKIATSEFRYNNADLMIESKDIDEKGKVYIRKEFKYNKQGKVIEELIYDENNAFFGKKASFYDDKGNVTGQYSSDASNNPVEQLIYTYDKKSRLKRLEVYTNNLFSNAIEYEYNSDDKVSLQRLHNSDPVSYSDLVEIKYDKHGNPVSEISMASYEKTKRSFQYDASGNIVRMILLQDNQLPVIEKREYKYY